MSRIDEVLVDPAASHWLKGALRTGLERDCVDAAEDAAVLAELLGERADAMLARHMVQPAASSSVEKPHA